ncbi:choline transporter [Halarcobacter mediterraneus]|uniref:Choline transporter n=1 Tax=Halarcobacter mediterraneus TaxID=2023153 RepID=A0A4Q1AWS8_9BACT|nr:BCCT family transporter [Halarcobacter mediterraneus]RXK14614.1 choline transporter [Halarcobacter mediterraneus]
MLEKFKKSNSTILIPVFIPAVIVILLLVIGAISNPKGMGEVFSVTLTYITNDFGWFYMLAVALFLIFIVSIALSPWGQIKLGPDHSEPEYSFSSWFAMLFSAGYGIALLFFGVAEPILHYASPPTGEGQTIAAAKQAMQIAYFHWGFHIWAIYGLVGLTLAYFAFRHGLPLSMRSTLYPLIGEKIHGPVGHTVDTFAILGTLFGIATTLGLSVSQINAGLNYLWPEIEVNINVQIITIAIITALALFSVLAGMDKGVKRLSLLNILLAISLMVFVFIVGPTIFILNTFLENTGSYLSNIVERTFSLQAYTSNDWIGNWTLFIFGWTIAWAPFVGLFIAKISKGRTIRQFVVGVMLVPTIFTFLWFSIFGDTALHMVMVQGYESLITEVQNDKAIALFKLFERLPLTNVLSFIAVFLIITFFVTSSDSGSLVIDSLASGGAIETPAWQRSFWVILEGVVASVLLIAGGLTALQTASIVSALPFAIIMIIAGIGMWRALIIENHRENSLQHTVNMNFQHPDIDNDEYWKGRLKELINFPKKNVVEKFIKNDVQNSMKKIQKELKESEWDCDVDYDEEYVRAIIFIYKDDDIKFTYEVRLREYEIPEFAHLEDANKKQKYYYNAEAFLKRGGLHYDLYGYEEHTIINDILTQFERYLRFVHTTPATLPWDMEEHDDLLDNESQTNK